VVGGHLDELGERPVVGNTEDTVFFSRHPRIVPPVERRVYNDLGPLIRPLGTLSAGYDLAGPVGARNPRKNVRRNPRILPLRSEQIPAIQRRRP
jgi:hypothetical protein